MRNVAGRAGEGAALYEYVPIVWRRGACLMAALIARKVVGQKFQIYLKPYTHNTRINLIGDETDLIGGFSEISDFSRTRLSWAAYFRYALSRGQPWKGWTTEKRNCWRVNQR